MTYNVFGGTLNLAKLISRKVITRTPDNITLCKFVY